jgi:holliday junction DNA helicase RuvA
MMTKLTGTLTKILDDEARVAVEPYEFQVLISEANRRTLQLRVGQTVTFHISEYLEGNQSGTRFIPRKIGFLTELELDFFDLFCTVEKIGAKKALKAMARGVRDIADAVNRSDTKWLTTLPGIGATTSEQMITTMKRKIAPFLMARSEPVAEVEEVETVVVKKPKTKTTAVVAAPEPSEQVVEDIYTALIQLGLGPQEARDRIDVLLRSGQTFTTHGEALKLIFATKK